MKTIKSYSDDFKHTGYFFKIPEGVIVWVPANSCFIAGGKHAQELKRLNREDNTQ